MTQTSEQLFDEVRKLSESGKNISARLQTKFIFAAMQDLRNNQESMKKKVDSMYLVYRILLVAWGILVGLGTSAMVSGRLVISIK